MSVGLIQSVEDLQSKDWGFPKKEILPQDWNMETLPDFKTCQFGAQDCNTYSYLNFPDGLFYWLASPHKQVGQVLKIKLSICLHPNGSLSMENPD